MRLYEIAPAYMELEEALERGEITEDEFLQKVLELGEDLTSAVEYHCKRIKNLEAKVDAIDPEKKRLQELQASLKNQADKAKKYLHDHLVGLGVDKVSAGIFTATVQASPAKVVVGDVEALQPQWLKKKLLEADTAAIKNALKNGELVECDNIQLVTGSHLRIK